MSTPESPQEEIRDDTPAEKREEIRDTIHDMIFDETLEETRKHSPIDYQQIMDKLPANTCFICGKRLSSRQNYIKHMNNIELPDTKDPAVFEFITNIVTTQQPKHRINKVEDTLDCMYCKKTLYNKYYRNAHEKKCRLNPAIKFKNMHKFMAADK